MRSQVVYADPPRPRRGLHWVISALIASLVLAACGGSDSGAGGDADGTDEGASDLDGYDVTYVDEEFVVHAPGGTDVTVGASSDGWDLAPAGASFVDSPVVVVSQVPLGDDGGLPVAVLTSGDAVEYPRQMGTVAGDSVELVALLDHFSRLSYEYERFVVVPDKVRVQAELNDFHEMLEQALASPEVSERELSETVELLHGVRLDLDAASDVGEGFGKIQFVNAAASETPTHYVVADSAAVGFDSSRDLTEAADGAGSDAGAGSAPLFPKGQITRAVILTTADRAGDETRFPISADIFYGVGPELMSIGLLTSDLEAAIADNADRGRGSGDGSAYVYFRGDEAPSTFELNFSEWWTATTDGTTSLGDVEGLSPLCVAECVGTVTLQQGIVNADRGRGSGDGSAYVYFRGDEAPSTFELNFSEWWTATTDGTTSLGDVEGLSPLCVAECVGTVTLQQGIVNAEPGTPMAEAGFPHGEPGVAFHFESPDGPGMFVEGDGALNHLTIGFRDEAGALYFAVVDPLSPEVSEMIAEP